MGKDKRRERREQQKKQKKEQKQKRKRTFREMLPPDWDILAVILLLALGLRMWFAFSYDATLYDQAGEGVRYIGMVGGEPVDTMSPPLYILFLRICLGIFGRGAAQAAFVVKVSASSRSGGMRSSKMNLRYRSTRTRVFPVPAPALTRTSVPVLAIASR